MNSLQGYVLVASPHLLDSNFLRSVVLIIQHNDQGAFGVVLNRPTNNTIAQLWGLVSQTPCDNPSPVYVGGPVPGPLVAIHGDAALSELEIVPGVHFASSKESIVQLVTQSACDMCLFVGYSGWAAGQLDGELQAGGWLTERATREDVFSPSEDLWNRVARRIGLQALEPTFKHLQIPNDPSMN